MSRSYGWTSRREGRGDRMGRSSRFRLIDVKRFMVQMRHPTRLSAIRAAIDGVMVSWTIKQRGIRPLLSRVAPEHGRIDSEKAAQVSAAVDAGLGLIPMAPTCLRRSMTLVRELNRLELAGTVHIGVRNVSQDVEAHAWVQVGDVVVNDDPRVTGTYSELVSGDLEALLPLLK